jgi:hypothetical protein
MHVIAKANLECGGKSKGAAPHRLKKEGLAAIEQWLQVAVDLKICAVASNTYNRSKNSELCQITLLEISKSNMLLLSAKDLIENLSLSLSLHNNLILLFHPAFYLVLVSFAKGRGSLVFLQNF